jgi:uncharacterized caspase-like protein
MSSTARRAVIIGIDDYSDPDITTLTGACNDAREIHERLTQSGDFKVEDHHFLLNTKASTSNIRQAISDLLWKTEESEFSLLYFSGHGLTDAYGNGFIAPHDMIRNHPLVCGIKMQELRELMLDTKHKQTVLLILDCCYSGIAADGDKAVGSVPGNAIEKCLEPLDQSEYSGSGRLIFTSAGSAERSREVALCQHRLGRQAPHPHGAFSFRILEGLDGQASLKSHDITLGSLIRCVTGSLSGIDRPKLYGSAATSLDTIFLCRASKQAQLERQVAEVRRLLSNEDDLFNLFRAIKSLELILSEAPDLSDAFELRSQIDDRLAPLRASAAEVLLLNMLDLSDGCEETFSRLQDAVCRDNFNFNTITCEATDLRNLILCLFQVAEGKVQPRVLQSNLIAFHSRATRNLLSPPDPSSTV